MNQLCVDISGDSISSDSHYSFHRSGKIVGCYGRAPSLSPSEHVNVGAQVPLGGVSDHRDQPKRQHRIIGRQRLRQLMVERLQPNTVSTVCLWRSHVLSPAHELFRYIGACLFVDTRRRLQAPCKCRLATALLSMLRVSFQFVIW